MYFILRMTSLLLNVS